MTHNEKLNDKVDMRSLRDTDFLDKISACVWSVESEPYEFEQRWNSIMHEFELDEHDWLKTMFTIREMWILVYFRDLPMSGLLRTTSRLESANSFFSDIMNN